MNRWLSRLIKGIGTQGDLLFLAVLTIAIVAFPFANILFPEDSALHVSSFTLGVWGKYLCFAVLAISLNVLWGYTGLLCLGQCLFFALGGYAFGMYLMLMIGELGSYGRELPDFMVFLGYEELPIHWRPFYNPGVAISLFSRKL